MQIHLFQDTQVYNHASQYVLGLQVWIEVLVYKFPISLRLCRTLVSRASFFFFFFSLSQVLPTRKTDKEQGFCLCCFYTYSRHVHRSDH